MPSAESILFKIFIAVVVVGVIVIVVLVAPRFLPSPATVTPSTTVLDSGQTAVIDVAWKGGLAPYTITLFASTSGACTTSSTVAGVKSIQSGQPQTMFSVSPTVTTRYCGLVSSAKGSSTISPSVLVTVYPALGVPTLSLSNALIDSGQIGTITATVEMTGGTPPFTVTLYSGTSGTCSSDTTVVKTTSGSNPIVSLAGTTAVFSFAAPTVGTYYCAGVSNSATSPSSIMSATSDFDIDPALAVSVSPGAPKLDAGQSITLSALASMGTPTYSYQWYSGLTCSTPITGQTTSTLSTGTLTTTSTYSVKAGDSSFGTPAAGPCASVTVTVSSAFTGTTVSIGPSALLDNGQKASLTVSWGKVGTLPYSVRLTTSSSSACSSPTPTTLNMTGLSAPTAVFQVTPSSTTFYCATVSDGATSPESASTTTAVTISVNPALSSSIVLSTPAIDAGQAMTLIVTATPSGGTSPYTVTLRGGSSVTCSSDAVLGVSTGPGYQFSMPAPSSSTYYCATVTDSAPTPVTATSASLRFLVNPALSATISPTTPSLVQGKSVTLTATPSGGTSPYAYQWYSGTTCSTSGKLAGKTASAYSTPLLNATGSYSYSVRVTDSSPGTPADSVCASTTATVTAVLVATFALSPQGIDTGQSVTVTATVTLAGGTPPYTVALHSGTSATCASDTTVVTVLSGSNPQTGVTKSPATFTFASPKSSTYYCAVVTDSASTPATVSTSTLSFAVNPTLDIPVLTITPLTVLDSGQSSNLLATVTWSGGTSPYNVTLRSGSTTTCASDTTVVTVLSGSNPQTGVTKSPATFTFASPKSSTYYCATVTDSGSPPLTALSTTSLFTVNPAVSVGAPTLSVTVLDSGQPSTSTATVTWSGGTSPYAVTLLSGSSATCSSDTTVVAVSPGSNPETGLTVTTATFTFVAPASSTYYCASVSDSSPVAVTVLSLTSLFTRNPALSVGTPTLSVTFLDSGQTGTITATVTWTGGTSPYTVTLYSGTSSSCSLDTTKVGSASVLVGSPASFSFSAPSATTYYCAQVIDSASTHVTVLSSTAEFTVNPKLAASAPVISPTVIDSGQGPVTITATVSWSGGTAPYTVTLYSGSSSTCSSDTVVVSVSGAHGPNPKSGLTNASASFTFTSPNLITYYCATVTDSASTPVTVLSSTAEFTVNPALTPSAPVISPAVLDFGQSATVTAAVSWSGGTAPYTVTFYSSLTGSCSSSSTVVAVSGSNPQTGVTKLSATFTFTPPVSDTYYCATVTDSASTPVTVLSSASMLTVNPALSPPTITASPTTIDSGQSSTLSTTATFSGGTSTYTCQWLQEAPGATKYSILGSSFSCTTSSTPSTPTGTLSTVGTWNFEFQVTDSSGVPVTAVSSSVSVAVNTALSVTSFGITPSYTDQDLPVNVTAMVSWSGGTAPYTVTLYSGSSSTCSSDTEVVTVLSGTNPKTGLANESASFTFASPGSSQYYCAVVTDSSTPAVSAFSSTAEFTVYPLPASPIPLDSGQSSPYVATTYSSAYSSDTVTVSQAPVSANPRAAS